MEVFRANNGANNFRVALGEGSNDRLCLVGRGVIVDDNFNRERCLLCQYGVERTG